MADIGAERKLGCEVVSFRFAPKAVIDNSLFGPSTRTASLTREREQSRTRLGPGPRRVRVPPCNRFV